MAEGLIQKQVGLPRKWLIEQLNLRPENLSVVRASGWQLPVYSTRLFWLWMIRPVKMPWPPTIFQWHSPSQRNWGNWRFVRSRRRCVGAARVKYWPRSRPGECLIIGSWLADSETPTIQQLAQMDWHLADGRYPVNDAELKEVFISGELNHWRSLIRNGPLAWMLKTNTSPIDGESDCRQMVPANQRSSNCWRACWHKPVWLRSMEKILMILKRVEKLLKVRDYFSESWRSLSTRPFNERWSGCRAGHGWLRHDYEGRL